MLVACGAGDERIDPSDLELRDLLGVAPEVATRWDAQQRSAARGVLLAHLGDPEDLAPHLVTASGSTGDPRVIETLAAYDVRRSDDGDGALGLVGITDAEPNLLVASRPAPVAAATLTGGRAPAADIQLSTTWDQHAWGYLPGRGLDVLAALALDARTVNASEAGAPIVVVPASRLAVLAAYVSGAQPELLVNPVLLAALEPQPGEHGAITTTGDSPPAPTARLVTTVPTGSPPIGKPSPSARPDDNPTGGNPYSFYGTVEECAAAERNRCTACLAASNCTAITSSDDGNNECTTFGSGDGSGYFLICINLSLAIGSVDDCVAKAAPSCARDAGAVNTLAGLSDNSDFLSDSTCASALDACLTQIYGAPSQTFPGLDGGIAPSPPRSTNVSCDNSCSSNNNANCNFSPSCSGPSGCAGSTSACSSSGDSGGGCDDGCSGDDTSSSSGGGCSGGSASSGGGCDSCNNNSSSSGGGCNSCSNTSSSGCGGGGCGSSDSGCGGSSSSGNCNVAPATPGPVVAIGISVMWGLLPLPFAALLRRRKRGAEIRDEEVQP